MTTSKLLPLFDTLENQQPLNPQHPYPKDLQFAHEFIYSYRGSAATFNVYRREIERLLQWSTLIAKKSLKQLRRPDIESYLQFCQAPPDHWIALKKTPRFVDKQGQRCPNTEWRPFVCRTSDKSSYQLSPAALRSIFSVLSSFYHYLIQEDYMEFNPVSQIRQKSKFIRKHQQQAPVRRLSELQWAYVIETAEMVCHQDSSYERSLFILNALYGMYLRISELAASERWQPMMNHFFRDADGNWWFRTVGKGNKERQIVVSNAMLAALRRYRTALGLTELPDQDDLQPLIHKSRGKGAITSTRQIRSLVQVCFDQAYERMVEDGLSEDAQQLRAATVHWLRHTGISEDVKHRPREHVRDDAGHSSSAITDRYIDIEQRDRHRSGKNKTIVPP